MGRLGRLAGDLRPPAGAPVADVVERRDRRREVERFGVRRHGGRHEPDVAGHRADQRRDQHRIEPTADLIGASVGTAELRRLQPERVLDREEVEQAALGGRRERRPVRGGEDLGRPRRRVAPARRVEAGAVERDGEMQRTVRGAGHHAAADQSVAAVRRLRPRRSSALNVVKSVVSRNAGIGVEVAGVRPQVRDRR